MLLVSVTATAGISAAAQALTSFFTGIAPSNSECSVWTRRWMNRGAVMLASLAKRWRRRKARQMARTE